MKHIVIIGGGFGGLNLIKHLGGKKGFSITLVDRNNYNFFPPLLYQVATGFLEPSNISYPFRKFLRRFPNVNFQMAEFISVLPEQRRVLLSTGELSYDYLVFATGVSTSYFGMENIIKYGHPMKTLNDALNLRNHLLQTMEAASVEIKDSEKQKLLTVVIAGAGPTGVEIAGMLADMQKHILYKDYPELRSSAIQPKIILVDFATAVLKPMSDKTHRYTHAVLTKMGVDIQLGVQVKDYIDEKVIFGDGTAIETKTLVWAAGIGGTTFEGIPATSYGRGTRIKTDPFHRVENTENIFAVGDVCIQTHEKRFPDGHPQMAQPAIQQGKNLAHNLQAIVAGRQPRPFSYFDKGSMAIIGRNKGVVDLPNNRMHFQGFLAWTMWLGIHLLFLVNTRNRIKTLYNWITAYFSRDQSLRMIIRPEKEVT